MEKLYSSGIASALARRTVHIKMQPSARTFSERREVLRVLQNFGEVTMFRSYKVLGLSAFFTAGSDMKTVPFEKSRAQRLPLDFQGRVGCPSSFKCEPDAISPDYR